VVHKLFRCADNLELFGGPRSRLWESLSWRIWNCCSHVFYRLNVSWQRRERMKEMQNCKSLFTFQWSQYLSSFVRMNFRCAFRINFLQTSVEVWRRRSVLIVINFLTFGGRGVLAAVVGDPWNGNMLFLTYKVIKELQDILSRRDIKLIIVRFSFLNIFIFRSYFSSLRIEFGFMATTDLLCSQECDVIYK